MNKYSINLIKIMFFCLILSLFYAGNYVTAANNNSIPAPKNLTGGWINSTEADKYIVVLNWDGDDSYYDEEVESDYSDYGYILSKDGKEIYAIDPSSVENNDINYNDTTNLSNGGMFFDTEINAEKEYQYSVVAFDLFGNKSNPAEITVKVYPDREKECKAELTLDGSADEEGNVSLSWNEVCDADEYRMFRDDKQLKTTDKTDYIDQKVPEGKYKYKVEAWGPKTSSNNIKNNFFISAAKAEDKGKKAEGEKDIEVKKGGNNQGSDNGSSFGSTLPEYISNIYNWSIGIAAGLAVIMLIYAGYLYVTSAGNPESINLAKEVIIGAIAGFVFLVLAALILRFVM